MASSYQDRIKARRGTGVNKKKKVKPVSNDPRPVWKKGESREEYRKRLLPWRERQKAKKEKEKAEDLKKRGLKKTSRGLKKITKTGNDLKIKKGVPYAKDRVGSVNLNSKEYKAAKEANERKVEYQTKKTSGVGPVKDGDSYAKKLKKTTQGIGPVKDGKTYDKNATKYKQLTQEELDKKIAETKNEKKSEGSGKKESRWIRNPKTKTLVRRTSQKGKQLLKIQARKDALIKKRFGDKKKKKKK